MQHQQNATCQSRVTMRRHYGKFTKQTPAARDISGVPSPAEAAQSLDSSASADTDTRKKDLYCLLCLKIVGMTMEIKLPVRLATTKSFFLA